MKRNNLFIHKAIATAFGVGYAPFAPGTMGALLAVALWLVGFCWLDFAVLRWVTLVAVCLFTVLGAYSATALKPVWGKDPSRVVMDEVVGTWIALLAVPEREPLAWGYVLGAFVLFRVFDIFKPLGIRRMERFPDGVGVMADDLLAGIYSFILLVLVQWL